MKLLRVMLGLASIVNKERNIYNLPEVSYNTSVHQELLKYDQNMFYSRGNQSSSFEVNNTTRTNDLQGSFIKPLGFNYMFRDTISKPSRIRRIFKMRINQGNCVSPNKCSNETFNLFTSCMKDPIILENSKKCSWVYAYYPPMLQRSMTQFACVILEVQGTFVPDKLKDKQHHSFWCYNNADVPRADNFLFV
jgi:hypothetical protein